MAGVSSTVLLGVAALGATSAAIGAYGRSKVAKTQLQAADSARAAQQAGIDRARPHLEAARNQAMQPYQPYMAAGQTALGMYQDGLQSGFDIQNTPLFNQQLELMNKNLGQNLAAAGKSRSGVGISSYSMPAYGQLLQNETNSYFDRLNPLINYGYNAAANISGIQQSYGNNMANVEMGQGTNAANYYQNIGNINSDKIAGITNDVQSSISDLAQYIAYNQQNKKIK